MKEQILISACLMGVPCRYDGRKKYQPWVAQLRERYELIPMCPEQLGGLPTPRHASERVGDRVLTEDNTDVTDNYLRGARTALKLAEMFGCSKAILKERSPSCGCGEIYDGTFSRTLTVGNGVAAEQLKAAGIRIYGESQVEELL